MLRRRTGLVAVACVLVLGAGAVAAFQVGGPARAARPAPSPEPTRLPVLPASGEGAAVPSQAGLQRAIAAGLRDPSLGGHVALSVLDAVSGRPLLESDSSDVVTPASTAKIATAFAALTVLAPDRRLTTRVLAGAAPGDVVLVGGGDATLAGPLAQPAYPPVARLTDLAAQVRGTRTVTRVLVDDSLYAGPLLGPGWRPQYVTSGDVAPVTALMVDGGRTRRSPSRAPRQGDPALAAGRQLAALLGAPAATVVRGRAAAGAPELAAVLSPTVQQLVERMLTRSDNDIAEALARQVAMAKGQPPTFAGAAVAVGAAVGPGFSLQDGSGLSRLSRLQPGALTRLLAQVAGAQRDRLFPVLSGLPVAGFDGTLEQRYRRGPELLAAGVVRAKTGTLDGVSALAGLVRTRDGRLLAFDLTADRAPLGRTLDTQQALDRLAAALAGCGCP